MNDLQRFKDIIRRQQDTRHWPVNKRWDRIKTEQETEADTVTIKLPDDCIGFVFDRKTGTLRGIYNWKD